MRVRNSTGSAALSCFAGGGDSPKPGDSGGFRATDVSEQSKHPSRSQNVICEAIARHRAQLINSRSFFFLDGVHAKGSYDNTPLRVLRRVLKSALQERFAEGSEMMSDRGIEREERA